MVFFCEELITDRCYQGRVAGSLFFLRKNHGGWKLRVSPLKDDGKTRHAVGKVSPGYALSTSNSLPE